MGISFKHVIVDAELLEAAGSFSTTYGAHHGIVRTVCCIMEMKLKNQVSSKTRTG